MRIMRWLVWGLSFAVLAAASYVYWARQGEPVSMREPWVGPVQSFSFAPYRRGQSPLTMDFPDQSQIQSDLAAVAPYTKSVRTYTALEGLERLPDYARAQGVTIIQGAWLGWVRRINEREIESVIRLANEYPDVINSVIVGNENLLRGDVKLDALKGYIRRVRSAIKQPVSYADVWEFWLRNPSLADEVDFITVHFLPYWEDHPVSVENAMEHIRAVKDKVQAAFPGKPILIGEVGWPTAGRPREGAVPGRVEAAQFLNSFANLAAREGWNYNIVEAFDQGWKTALEGTVGGAWGLLDHRRQPKFELGASVAPNPQWRLDWYLTLALALALGFSVMAGRGQTAPRALFMPVLLALAFILAGALAFAWVDGATRSYYPLEWTRFALIMALNGALAWALMDRARRCASGGGEASVLFSPAEFWRECKGGWIRLFARTAQGRALRLAALYALSFSWLLIEVTLLILHIGWKDFGRYHDFPIADFMLPLAGSIVTALIIGVARGSAALAPVWRSPSRLLIIVVAITAAVWLVGDEKITNVQAVILAGMTGLMAWPMFFRSGSPR